MRTPAGPSFLTVPGPLPAARVRRRSDLPTPTVAAPATAPRAEPARHRSTARHRPLVVAGIPRSGTTWTKQVLEQDSTLVSIMEPDSEGYRAAAIRAKRDVGRFPVLRPGEWDEPYFRLWSWIVLGAPTTLRQRAAAGILRRTNPARRGAYFAGRPSPLMTAAGALADLPVDRVDPGLFRRGLLVKTVHAPLALEWVATEFDVDVLVVLRHPGSVLASWLEVRSPEQAVPFADDDRVLRLAASWGVRPPGPDRLERTVWQIGVLTTALRQALTRQPGWSVRTHEGLCADPVGGFRDLYQELGLTWTDEVAAYIGERDRPGTGYVTKRVASVLPGNWRTRLTPAERTELFRVLSWFPDSAGVDGD